jgi:hypothetical protein
MIVKIFILLGLVKFLRVSGSVITCAVIYGVMGFLFTLIFKNNISQALMTGLVGGALSFIYFWLLHKFEDSFFWWIILIGGVAIGLV